jgi:NADH dehydrogenase FAD-containing subunit
MGAKPKVVVIGGGFAGLETLFCLRHQLGERVELALVSNDKNFVFRPDTIYVPFGADPKRFVVPLSKVLADTQAEFLYDRARAIDCENRVVALRESELRFDYLVVASGASVLADEIPGLPENATSLWTVGGMLKLRRAFEHLIEDARRGARRKLLFLLPRHNLCASPLYELIFLTDTWLRSRKVREPLALSLATFEKNLVGNLGRPFDALIRERLEERDVEVHSGLVVTEVEPDRCRFANGERLDFDLLVSFPPHLVPKPFEGLANDERGCVRVLRDSRRVVGQERVFAVGDASAHAVKRAYLALLQADAAAEHIAAELTSRAPAMSFEATATTLEEAMKRVTFEHAPQAEPRTPANQGGTFPDVVEVGVAPLWRAGARAVGLHLPWCLGPGEPFHRGLEALRR